MNIKLNNSAMGGSSRHAKLNAREKELKGTAVYGVNQFSDWTPQEFRGNFHQFL